MSCFFVSTERIFRRYPQPLHNPSRLNPETQSIILRHTSSLYGHSFTRKPDQGVPHSTKASPSRRGRACGCSRPHVCVGMGEGTACSFSPKCPTAIRSCRLSRRSTVLPTIPRNPQGGTRTAEAIEYLPPALLTTSHHATSPNTNTRAGSRTS